MGIASLRAFLTSVIAEGMSNHPSEDVYRGDSHSGRAVRGHDPMPSAAAAIAEELIEQAVGSGLPLTGFQVANTRLGGGNTAEVVAHLTLHAPFAFKLDQVEEKVAAEALMMRSVRRDERLPARFRDAWPIVYAIRNKSPYAYLMEYFPKEEGWLSLEDRLYPETRRLLPSASDALRLIHAILDVLFGGFEASVERRFHPSVRQDYVERIRQRLDAAAKLDDRFRSQKIVVKGRELKPWQHYLDILDRNASYLDEITPQFTTVTHGDPNPGNLILRTTSSEVEVKLIDPKDWVKGDYLFDITKICHFIEGTGPIEKPSGETQPTVEYRAKSGLATLEYTYGSPSWTSLLVEASLERTSRFAEVNRDVHWRARYQLGMASNYLGLPAGRLARKSRDRVDAALMLFGEGLTWLDQFCERLGRRSGRQSSAILVMEKAEPEPESLKKVRDFVRSALPGIKEGEDRRGFQLIQWNGPLFGSGDRLAELSLEHEARLTPMNDRGLEQLRGGLHASEGLRVADGLLPERSRFATLIVRHKRRDPGAQSVDRYYDSPRKATLIPRMITLRERTRTSGFMTWNTASPTSMALNLELPFVAFGTSGMTARLELNWISTMSESLMDFAASENSDSVESRRNPLWLAARAENVRFDGVESVLEHTTYREKFGLFLPAASDSPERPVFEINIDRVVAQAVETGRLGSYIDVDIAPCGKVDHVVLDSVMAFAAEIASRYELEPTRATKAWRDAQVTGLLVE